MKWRLAAFLFGAVEGKNLSVADVRANVCRVLRWAAWRTMLVGFVVCEPAGAFEDKCWSKNIIADEVMIFVSFAAVLSFNAVYCVACIVKHAVRRLLPNMHRALY